MRQVAVIRSADLSDSNAAKVAGHPWAVQAHRAKILSSSQRPFGCAGNRPGVDIHWLEFVVAKLSLGPIRGPKQQPFACDGPGQLLPLAKRSLRASYLAVLASKAPSRQSPGDGRMKVDTHG